MAQPAGGAAFSQGGEPTAAFLDQFTRDEQDPDMVRNTLKRLVPLLIRGEEILYIAIQKRMASPIAPDSLVLTNRRFILFQPRMLGQVSFVDHNWRDLNEAKMEEKVFGAVVTLYPAQRAPVVIERVHKEQARRVYSIAREMRDRAHEDRRQRDLEAMRAQSGQVNVANLAPGLQFPFPAYPAPGPTPGPPVHEAAPRAPAPSPPAASPEVWQPVAATRAPAAAPRAVPATAPAPQDPHQALSKLKSLLDAGLITSADFDRKKADILSRL